MIWGSFLNSAVFGMARFRKGNSEWGRGQMSRASESGGHDQEETNLIHCPTALHGGPCKRYHSGYFGLNSIVAVDRGGLCWQELYTRILTYYWTRYDSYAKQACET